MLYGPTLTVGSLFAGIGGIELGLERTGGFKTLWQVENDPYAIRVLEKHWPDVRRWDDVATFPPDAEESGLAKWSGKTCGDTQGEGIERGLERRNRWYADLIAGGFPCQPVSCAGRRAGETDERWLWDEMRRVCEILRPAWVLVENVPGLLSARDVRGIRGALFGRIVHDLAAFGHRVEWDCLSAAAVGASHIRERVFILAHTGRSGSEPWGAAGDGSEAPRGTETAAPERERVWSSTHDGGSDVANATADGRQPRRAGDAAEGQTGRKPNRGSGEGDVPNAEQHGLQGTEHAVSGQGTITRQRRLADEGWWAVEPDVCRVADGVPHRVDRLRCLGNAVVPQVAEFVGNMILQKIQTDK